MKPQRLSPLLSIPLTFVFGFICSCSEPSQDELAKRAAEGEVVWLADVNAAGARVQFTLKQLVTTNALSSRLRAGQQYRGPKVEPGTKYGEEALLFFSDVTTPTFDLVVVLNGGRTFSGATQEELLARIQKAARVMSAAHQGDR